MGTSRSLQASPDQYQERGIIDCATYRQLLALKRCVIPSDGLYEWRKQLGQWKQPYSIGLRSGESLALAGLWDTVKEGDDWLVSCANLTTGPNPLVATLHVRQPVILTLEQAV
jgi:putative SOS response-associated peptidase YedK